MLCFGKNILTKRYFSAHEPSFNIWKWNKKALPFHLEFVSVMDLNRLLHNPFSLHGCMNNHHLRKMHFFPIVQKDWRTDSLMMSPSSPLA